MTRHDDERKRLQRFLNDPGENDPPTQPSATEEPRFETAGIRIRSDRPRLGKYSLLRTIGRGGMSTVYEAMDEDLQRRVALKVLREGAADPRAIERFRREATILAKLQHPHLVPIFEIDAVEAPSGDPVHFISMQLIQGRPFSDLLADPTTPRATCLDIIEEVCRVVDFVHAQGVIHRDLKPGNIMIEVTGRVLLMDFGLAQAELFQARLTRAQAVMGTPGYMAPEQVKGRGDLINERTDVYALGVMLYECLAGRPPFWGSNPGEVYQKILEEEPVRPSKLGKGVEPDLERICLMAMEKDPRHRYRRAGAMAEDIGRFRRGEPISAIAPPLANLIRRHISRRKTGVFSAILAAGFLIFIFAGLLPQLGRTKSRLEETQAQLFRNMKAMSAMCLQSALDLRRAGNPQGMDYYAEKLKRSCDDVSALFPDLAEPPYCWGRMLRAQLKFQEALAAQEKALQKNPDYAPALYEHMVLSATLHRLRSTDLMREVDPGNELFLAAGMIKKSFTDRKLSPEDLRAVTPAGRDVLKTLEADLARIESILKKDPGAIGTGETDCARGMVLRFKDDTEGARRLLARAIERAPFLEEAHEALAAMEMDLGHFDEANRRWTKAIEADPGYVLNLEGRAACSMRSAYALPGPARAAFLEPALKDLDRALKLFPGRSESLLNRALARLFLAAVKAKPGLEEATAYFDAALEDCAEVQRSDSGRGTDAHLIRGFGYLTWGIAKSSLKTNKTDSYQKSFDEFTEAARMSPNRDDPWLFKNMLHVLWAFSFPSDSATVRDLLDEAVRDCDEALTRNPGRLWTWVRRGFTNSMRGCANKMSPDRALELFEESIRDFQRASSDPRLAHEAWALSVITRINACAAAEARGRDATLQYEALLKEAEEGVRWWPGWSESWSYRAMAKTQAGGRQVRLKADPSEYYTASIEDLTKAIQIAREQRPEYAINPLMNRAILWHTWAMYKSSRNEPAQKEYQQAIADFQESFRLDPEIEKQFGAAIQKCEAYLKAFPPK